MAKPEKAKLIMELHAKKTSVRDIARTRHVSAHTVKDVLDRAKEKGLSWDNAAHLSAEEIVSALYPKDKQAQEALVRPDCGYVHDELSKAGVTLKLLWGSIGSRRQTTGRSP